ncbi:MAG: hypothetical protein GAK43_02604 [Stenotrophomonas maltophilia]|nr:MAG: hypothetical protein GAK43_02604 [Stenotrophomonas maltophilia]
MPTGVVEHIQGVEDGQVEALHVHGQRQQHGRAPDQHTGDDPGDEAAPVSGRPVQYREHAGEELQGRDERHDAQGGQVLAGAEQEVETVAEQDDGGDQCAAGPLQPAIDVAFGRWLVERQHQVVEDHAGQRQGHDDDQPAGGGNPTDERGQRQPRTLHRHTQAEGEVFRIGRYAQVQTGPEDRWYRQAHRQQEQRQPPTGGQQRARVEILGESHVIHVRHHDCRGEEHQQQGAPGAFGQWRVQCAERFLVLQQPAFQSGGAIEYAVQGEEADGAQCDKLDQRLEGDGHHQPFVAFAGGDMTRAEEDGEQRDQRAEGEGGGVRFGITGEDAYRVGDRLDLQRQHRQHADQHEQRGQCAGPGAAEAEGEQVGQRRQLVGAGNAQDRVEQHRCQQEGPGYTQVDGQEAVAVLVGQPHGAVEGPGAGVHPQRQGVDHRVADQAAWHEATLGDPGHAEQYAQVGSAEQDQLGEAKAHRHLAGLAGGRSRR